MAPVTKTTEHKWRGDYYLFDKGAPGTGTRYLFQPEMANYIEFKDSTSPAGGAVDFTVWLPRDVRGYSTGFLGVFALTSAPPGSKVIVRSVVTDPSTGQVLSINTVGNVAHLQSASLFLLDNTTYGGTWRLITRPLGAS